MRFQRPRHHVIIDRVLTMLIWAALLAGCGVNPAAGVSSSTATATLAPATATARALQQQVNAASFEATIVMATVGAIQGSTSIPPEVATEVARRYQDNVATWEALVPVMQTMGPLAPATVQPIIPAEATMLAEANAAAARPPVTPTPWDPPAELAETPGAAVPPVLATSPLPTPRLPDVMSFPTRPAPSALAGKQLPATGGDVVALIEALPPSIAGLVRAPAWESDNGAIRVLTYRRETSSGDAAEPRLVLNVQDVSIGGAPAGFSAAHDVVAITMALQDELGDGRDGHVSWVLHWEPTGRPELPELYLLHLGADNGVLLLSLQAPTREELELFIEAIAFELQAV